MPALAAECRLFKFSFRAWQKYCVLSLLSLGSFFEGILINISSKKNAFVRVFTLTSLWLSAILKLDFSKSPGKSGSASPPRGMKLGNIVFDMFSLGVGQSDLWLVHGRVLMLVLMSTPFSLAYTLNMNWGKDCYINFLIPRAFCRL